jgi:hypothetical protein
VPPPVLATIAPRQSSRRRRRPRRPRSATSVIVAIVAAFTSIIRPVWGRIAVRVGWIWIAAASLFMLGWSLRA